MVQRVELSLGWQVGCERLTKLTLQGNLDSSSSSSSLKTGIG